MVDREVDEKMPANLYTIRVNVAFPYIQWSREIPNALEILDSTPRNKGEWRFVYTSH